MKMNINPVLLKELKVKMRGWRSVLTITIYLSIIVLVTLFMVLNEMGNPFSSTIEPSRSISIYGFLSAIQFGLIMFIAPALTAGAISGERERQTLDLLLSTKLPSRSIILGKLLASISHIVLLIVASLPVFSIVFIFGGISIKEVLELFGFYIITAVTLGSIGLFYSSILKRTSISNVVTYGVIGFLVLGTIMVSAMYISYYYSRNGLQYRGIPLLLYVNPVAGFASLITEQFGMGSALSFLGVPRTGAVNQMSLWKGNIIFDAALSFILLSLSSMKINPVKKGLLRSIKDLSGRVKSGMKPANK